MSIENKGFVERFCFVNPFVMSDVNIWNNLMYTSLNFGILKINNIYLIIMIVLLITLIIDTIYFIFKNFEKEKLLMVSFITWWAFYFFLNVQMPYTCSMHSRYMVVPMAIATIMLAKGLQEEKNKVIKLQTNISVVTLSIMSLAMFLFI